MMLIPDKKKAATMILAKMSENGMKEESQVSENDSSLAVEDCMKRVLSAIERKDTTALAAALKDAFEVLDCENESEDYESSEE